MGMNWTPGRKKGYITSVLRKVFIRWPAKYEALKKALVGKKLNQKTGRMAYHYKCAKCKKEFPNVDVQVDHILPVVATDDGFLGWDAYIDRLYCESSSLQVLCTSCHKKKTSVENKERRKKK
jgi:5-methylcytosine-specific restriction endonuclease McrA